MTPLLRDPVGRFSFLDGLRGYAALIVVLHHCFISYVPALYTGVVADSHFSWDVWLSGQPILLLFFAGNFAVCIFFVLSGFVLAHVFSRTTASPLELTVRRYVRLGIPILASNLVILVIGVMSLLIVPLRRYIPGMPGALDQQFTAANVWSAVYQCVYEALVKAPILGIAAPTFNGVLWTMQTEFIGSFVLIIVFGLARLIAPKHVLTVATIICMALVAVVWLSQLSMFLAGMIIYRLFGQRTIVPTLWTELIGGVLIAAALYLGTMPESGLRPDFANVLIRLMGADMDSLYAKTFFRWAPMPLLPIMLWHAIGAEILLIGVFFSSFARRFFSSKVALFLGFVSFPLYLLQTSAKNLTADPIRNYLTSAHVDPLATLLLSVAVAAAAAIAAGYIFARTVEVRSIAWSNIAGRFAEASISLPIQSRRRLAANET